MNCSKDFEMEVSGSCSGLANDANWTYNPNNNPGNPPAGLTLVDEVEGYAGTWEATKAGAPDLAVNPNLEWRVAWTSVAGPTLTVRHTIVGSVNRVGQIGAIIQCRADANNNPVTDSILCPAGLITAVNLEAISQDATLGGPAFIDCFCIASASGTFSLQGTIEVSCA